MEANLSEFSVYTIVHVDDLKRIHGEGGAGTISENKKWVSGARLFHEAQAAGQRMAIIFADAATTWNLLYYGLLTKVEVLGETMRGPTRYSFEKLTPITPPVPKSVLLKKNDGLPLSDDHIRPYVLVNTPAFVTIPSEHVAAKGRISKLIDSLLPSDQKPTHPVTPIYLFGYSGKSDQQIEEAIGKDGLLVDIRYSPKSRRSGYSRAGLIRTFGERYRHVRELGNADYQSGGIRLADPDAGLAIIEEIAAAHDGPIFLMCACEDGTTCHRHQAGNLLKKRGYSVKEYQF